MNRPSTREEWREAVKPAAQWAIRRMPGRRARWGSLRRVTPFSTMYGWDRGLPVDRFYIERFLESNRRCVHGDVMEVRDDAYARRFGGAAVTRTHIVDVDAGNAAATLVADLCEPGSLPDAAYDCVLLTQTFHLLPDEGVALQNMWRALRPGGTLLLTAPCLGRVDHEIPDTDLWRYTPAGLERRVGEHCTGGELVVEGHGNVLAGIAFFMGLAVQELRESELALDDRFFPVVACARATKAP